MYDDTDDNVFFVLHDKLLSKWLIECTNEKQSLNIIIFSRNKTLKALQLEFNGSAQIHMTVHCNECLPLNLQWKNPKKS